MQYQHWQPVIIVDQQQVQVPEQQQQQQQQQQLPAQTQQYQGRIQDDEAYYDASTNSMISTSSGHRTNMNQHQVNHATGSISRMSHPIQQQQQPQQPSSTTFNYHNNNDERYSMNPNYIQPSYEVHTSNNNNNNNNNNQLPYFNNDNNSNYFPSHPNNTLHTTSTAFARNSINHTNANNNNNNNCMYNDDMLGDSFYSAKQSTMIGSSSTSYHSQIPTQAQAQVIHHGHQSSVANPYFYNTPVPVHVQSLHRNPNGDYNLNHHHHDFGGSNSTTGSLSTGGGSQSRYESFKDNPNMYNHHFHDTNNNNNIHDINNISNTGGSSLYQETNEYTTASTGNYHTPLSTTSMSNNNNNNRVPTSLQQHQQQDEVTVRIVSAETRYDITNKEYTAYIIRIVRPQLGITSEIERRYSEFYKLYSTLKKTFTIIAPLNIPFPSKHWAGRLGDWTPSKLWTPESYEDLIHTRTIELDLWLVQIVSLYNTSSHTCSNNSNNNNNNTMPSNGITSNNMNVPYMNYRSIPKGAYILIHNFLFTPHQAPCQVQPIEDESDGRTICVTVDENVDGNTINNLQHTFLKSMNLNGSSSSSSNGIITASSLKSSICFTKWNNPFSFTVSSAIRQATRTVEYMTADNNPLIGINDTSIPLDLLRCAKGIAFLTVLKAGMVVSGRIGTGIVIAKLNTNNNNNSNSANSDSPPWATATPANSTTSTSWRASATPSSSSTTNNTTNNGNYSTGLFGTPHRSNSSNNNSTIITSSQWSCPCAIGTVGLGWGAQMGGDVTHYMIVFTSEQAIYDFCSIRGDTSIQVGAEMSIAVGPVGRSAVGTMSAGDWSVHPAYAYALSQGLFVGISVEGSVVTVRHDINTKFYEESLHDTTIDDYISTSSLSSNRGSSFRASTTSSTKKKKPTSVNSTSSSNNNCASAISILQRPGCPAAKLLYNALDNALATEIPKYGFRPSLLFQNEATETMTSNPYS